MQVPLVSLAPQAGRSANANAHGIGKRAPDNPAHASSPG
jgi:hypothetical protein